MDPPGVMTAASTADIFLNDDGKFQGEAKKRVDVSASTWYVYWEAYSDQGWCNVEGAYYNGYFEVWATPNTEPVVRTATITLNAFRTAPIYIKVYQKAVSSLEISPVEEQLFSYGGGSFDLSIKCDTVWKIYAFADWIKCDVTQGVGDAVVRVTIEPAYVGQYLSDHLTVCAGGAEKHLAIQRDGDPNSDYIVLSPSIGFTVLRQGGEYTVQFISNTSWTVSTDMDWITVNPSSGSGDGSVKLIVAPNDTDDPMGCNVYFTAGKAHRHLRFYRQYNITDYYCPIKKNLV